MLIWVLDWYVQVIVLGETNWPPLSLSAIFFEMLTYIILVL